MHHCSGCSFSADSHASQFTAVCPGVTPTVLESSGVGSAPRKVSQLTLFTSNGTVPY